MTGRLHSRAAAYLCGAAVLLAGCGAAPVVPVTPSPQQPAVTVVTVPGLSSPGTGPTGTGSAEGGVMPARPSTTDAVMEDGPLSETDASTEAAPTMTAASGRGEEATTLTSQGVSSRTPVPPRGPGAATPSTISPPTTVAVDLAACAGCRVIGVAAEVMPGLAASLATAPQGAVLLATRADGTVVGVANVPYGVTFSAPSGGVLPCDRSGRCFVTARQSQGNGVISVFQLAAVGQWRDVTASGGFTSATTTALVRDVDGDGLLDIAVQADVGGVLRWVVHHWSGDRFAVLGCVAVSGPEPASAAVSLAACS